MPDNFAVLGADSSVMYSSEGLIITSSGVATDARDTGTPLDLLESCCNPPVPLGPKSNGMLESHGIVASAVQFPRDESGDMVGLSMLFLLALQLFLSLSCSA